MKLKYVDWNNWNWKHRNEEVEANATESEDKGRKVGEHVEHENENVEKYEREKGKW